jgi:hypothetical protein
MKTLILTVFFVILSLLSVSYLNSNSVNIDTIDYEPVKKNYSHENYVIDVNQNGNSVMTRFNTPKGYNRIYSDKNSWEHHLQSLPLKDHGSKVMHYDGSYKSNTRAYLAVVDLPIGKKDLHHCADAVMRLRADYLYSQKRYYEIEFLFASGKISKYKDWLNGETPNLKNYWKYMENVFAYASTLSLDKQLKRKNLKDMSIGDVFVKPGSPGHAVIVVDMCVNSQGKVKFMLAQSYMPAQEIQILVNPNDSNSPWYDLEFGDHLYTSEYIFKKNQIKTF